MKGLPTEIVGVPLIVIVPDVELPVKTAVTPVGKPVGTPIPNAPVVVCVIAVKVVFIHKVGLDDATLTVFVACTVIVPVAFTLPQPPVNGML